MEFILFLFYLVNALVLTFALFLVTYGLYSSSPDLEKFSVYECGFSPLSNARSKFDIKFYIVAILFIIFDIEIAFLFPGAVIFRLLSSFELFIIFLFVLILTIGFIHEWASGALRWS
jgi:NADH:ubiquinone oxidoreductase subunit 3 (subunit A)